MLVLSTITWASGNTSTHERVGVTPWELRSLKHGWFEGLNRGYLTSVELTVIHDHHKITHSTLVPTEKYFTKPVD